MHICQVLLSCYYRKKDHILKFSEPYLIIYLIKSQANWQSKILERQENLKISVSKKWLNLEVTLKIFIKVHLWG